MHRFAWWPLISTVALAVGACGTSDGGGAGDGGEPSVAGHGGTALESGGSSPAGASAGGKAGAGGSHAGGGGSAAIACDCKLSAQRPVCGVDHKSYDAVCGLECVPVAIACESTCPCPGQGGSTNGGSGGTAAGSGGSGAGIECGNETCGEGEYCRAGCNGVAGAAPGPPHCRALPAGCEGKPTCECVCSGFTQFCTPGAVAIQCGCG